MTGTISGGEKAAKTNKRRYGNKYYVTIGKMGGEAPASSPKGFAARPEIAQSAGSKGGKISRLPRTKKPGVLQSFLKGFTRG